MPQVYFGPVQERNSDYAEASANNGRWPRGHTLILPDGRVFRFTRAGAAARVAANLYQSIVMVADHANKACDVARAVGATAISATLGATAAAVDLFAEGWVNTQDVDGEGYNYRIKRAHAAAAAHAAVLASGIITVNLEPGETVQVALTTSSEVTFTRNRFAAVIIHDSPATADLVGVSPGVAAANRYYWSQTKGEACVLVQGTLVASDIAVPSASVDGAVMPSAAIETDGPIVGRVRHLGANGEHGLVDLTIE